MDASVEQLKRRRRGVIQKERERNAVCVHMKENARGKREKRARECERARVCMCV